MTEPAGNPNDPATVSVPKTDGSTSDPTPFAAPEASDFAPGGQSETVCAHWGEDRTQYRGAVVPPIFQNSLFTFPNCESKADSWAANVAARGTEAARLDAAEWIGATQYDYTRVSNPTTDITEAKIAALEGGERARCFGSGMGAISAAILSCVKGGDHVVCVDTVYGPTRQFLLDYLPRFGVTATFVEGTDPQQFADAMRPETTLLYLESPSSVVMKQQDLRAVAALAKAHGASTICDNSWASPIYQNPLKMGVDLVVHSATKYLGGHSDIVAGVAVGSESRMSHLIFQEGFLLGAVLDPFASWLLLRGLRTLPIRMERHQFNTREITRRLQQHPAVEKVLYPGLSDDPQPELTKTQLRGSGGLFSFLLKENSREAAYRFVNSLKYFGIGCSWGGFESLALPMTVHAHVLGATEEAAAEDVRWLIRLHIGLENVEDLWDDICGALARHR